MLSRFRRSPVKIPASLLLNGFRHPFSVFISGKEEDGPDDPVDDGMCDPDTNDTQVQILRDQNAQKDSAHPHGNGADDHGIGRIAGRS